MAGFSGKNLESSRPARLANALLHAFRRNLESELAELFGCGDSQRQIAPLMTAGQRGIDDNGLSHNFQKKTAARFRACSGVVLGGGPPGPCSPPPPPAPAPPPPSLPPPPLFPPHFA